VEHQKEDVAGEQEAEAVIAVAVLEPTIEGTKGPSRFEISIAAKS
jgi:hypothetical protein